MKPDWKSAPLMWGLVLLLGLVLGDGAQAAEPPSKAGSSSGGQLQTAVFAGGCFWCLEHDLEHLPGVVSAVSGYSGGHVEIGRAHV